MSNNDLRHLKTGGPAARNGGSSGNLPVTENHVPSCGFARTAFTPTSTPPSPTDYDGRDQNEQIHDHAAIPSSGRGPSALGRALDYHTSKNMNYVQPTSDARRPSDLRDGRAKTQRKARANQREKASRDEGPGAGFVGISAFSPARYKRYPQRAAGTPIARRASPITRWTTSQASNHTSTNACPRV